MVNDVISFDYPLTSRHGQGMKEFLEIPYNEKVVFDTREVKDCLSSNHGIIYKGL